MKSIPAKFPCGPSTGTGRITLEGEWLLPEGSGPFPAVVICHPHPPTGGTMFNSVVTAIWEELPRRSIAAFRFNFRGVGKSEGSFGEGVAEREDVRAALDCVASSPNVDTRRIGLAGYSFGAMMALPVARHDERVRLLALVSAPLMDIQWEQLKKYANPKLLIVGDADQMVPLERFQRQIKGVPDPEHYQIISGADHFLAGYEAEVARRVAGFFGEGFNKVWAG